MPDYKKILLVVDLSDDSQVVGERAKAIAACYSSEITLLHVVEYVPVEPMGEALLPTVQIESELVDRARKRLAELATKLSLGNAASWSRPAASRPRSSAPRNASAPT